MSLNYEQFECDQSEAPWVVLIHGLFGNLDNLAVLRRALQNDFNVLAIDLPDHGESPWVETFTQAGCVNALYELLAQQSISKCHLIGHSLGGKVAMKMALHHPGIISSLIVLDIAPTSYQPSHQGVFAGLKKVDLSSISSRKEADNVMQTEIKIAGVRQFLLKSLYQDTQGHWQWRFNVAGLEKDYVNISSFETSQDQQFAGPVTFIKGGESDYITREHQSTIAQLFPAAKAKIVEGVGHWLHAEKPQVVNKLVLRALQQ
ncbi:alpha/beta fold hydrolase [Alteromonas sp. chi3]|uniref:Alpha/beta fold hydrolase n=1 Tax=Alteromonas gilva TaxID=2987522 RepID=A0ABT5L459_9ALTE|nr:alpha/beta fold hydrolase [Alteromonas gilva]